MLVIHVAYIGTGPLAEQLVTPQLFAQTFSLSALKFYCPYVKA